jgi:cell wall assembly regulator SMI1
MDFQKTSKQITKEEIGQIEQDLGIKIPKDFVEHYLKNNGGVSNKRYFYSEESDIEIEIQVFSPIKHKTTGRTIEEKYLLFKQKSELMSDYLPFANDYGANQICVNLNNGEVCIVWMDQGEITEKCITFLAKDFKIFLASMSEESIDE